MTLEPRRSKVVHSQECEDQMFMFHAATGGDLECSCGAAEEARKHDHACCPPDDCCGGPCAAHPCWDLTT